MKTNWMSSTGKLLMLCGMHTYLMLGTVFAQTQGQTPATYGGQTPSTYGGQTPSTGGLLNPLKATDIQQFLVGIIDILLTFAIPIIVLFIMYGGFKLVTARGDTGQIEDGRRAITWAVIGGVIVLASKLIIGVIQGTTNALTG